MFLLDKTSQSLIGNAFPRVMPAASRLLNCNPNQIRNKYNQVLNQLSNRHLLFYKLLWLNDEVDSLTETQFLLRINKIDQELEEFMKAVEKDCHKYLGGRVEWSPKAGVWLK